MELADKVKENSTDAMLNTIVSIAANQNLKEPNALQLAHATAQNSEAMHNGTPLNSNSILSTAIGLVNTGLQAVTQNPEELVLSKRVELVEDEAQTSQMTAKTVGLAAATAITALHEDPTESLLQGTIGLSKQNLTVAETM